MSEARMELDLDFELLQLMVGLGGLAGAGAHILAEEIKGMLATGDEPAAPGEPPHGTGALRESWHGSKAGRPRRGKDRVTAYGYSLATADNGDSLNSILDEGRGSIHPHPFLTAAIARAEARFAAVIANEQTTLATAANAARSR